jgi:predicted nucleic acid-binding protein
MIVVANAGPLIALARIGHFNLLQSLYKQLYVPPAVLNEVMISGRGYPGADEVGLVTWIQTVNVQDKTAVQLLQERLDTGESEAIVLALELKADLLLIDEARGRRVAEARDLNKSGTIGALVLAKKRGLAPKMTPLLNALLASGFHIGEDLYKTAQMLTGESQ